MHYERYLVLDPESGALARYKKEDDAPLNPWYKKKNIKRSDTTWKRSRDKNFKG